MNFIRILLYAVICFLSLLQFLIVPVCSSTEQYIPHTLVQEMLRNKIETEFSEDPAVCRGEVLCSVSMMPLFYQNRDYMLAWIDQYGPTINAENLIKFIKKAGDEGLRPSDYHLYSINLLLEKTRQDHKANRPFILEDLVDLDLLLTDAFLLYCSHLLAGRVNAETLHTEWIPYNHLADHAAILAIALTEGKILSTLASLRPPHEGYKRMKKALKRLHKIERNGGWPRVDARAVLKKGDKNQHVDSLRRRLVVSGDLDVPIVSDNNYFDVHLEKGVRKFQARHGIKVDGRVGRDTLTALNFSTAERLRQIEINMERWRWIPHDMGARYLLVNIADFKLQVVEDLQNIMEMRVVVGKLQRKTPVFSEEMEYLVLNPFWYIPPIIVEEDLLPILKQDPSQFPKNNIKIYDGGSNYQQEIDPIKIDWSNITPENIPYMFRQDPGKSNALGRVKFMFPNKFFIYLHDTPSRNLFSETSRDFSSGCIRVEKPIELAAYLLRDDPVWTKEKIVEAIEGNERRVLRMRDKVQVHILYWTAWVDDNDVIHFRKDVYERDQRLDDALKERPPSP